MYLSIGKRCHGPSMFCVAMNHQTRVLLDYNNGNGNLHD